MAALTAASQKALANLRAFHPPKTTYPLLPPSRRAAVLILLFADPHTGHLRVVLTIRSARLSTYAGQAALPGGKADGAAETAFQTARREAWEEIGLPVADRGAWGWVVEELTELPVHLAATEVGVRPCVAFLHRRGGGGLAPRVDAREVAALFTAPFDGFLRSREGGPGGGEWYRGSWHSWHERAWRMHQFFVPVGSGNLLLAGEGEEEEERGRPGSAGAEPSSPSRGSALRPPLPPTVECDRDPLRQPRYRVFGLTARILVDCARVAYGEEPEFEHNSDFGDEEMIARLLRIGRLSAVRKEGEVLTREVMREAARVKI